MSGAIPPYPFLDALRRISRALDESGIDHVFVGGIAVVAWSRPRTTVDIDVLVAAEAADPEVLAEVLNREGFALEGAVQRDVLMAGFRMRRDYPGHPPVSVDVLASSNPAAIEIVKRGVSRTLAGITLRTPTVEDLIVLKLQAGRHQDLADCEALLAANRGRLDLDLLERQANAFDVAESLARLLPPDHAR